MPCVAMPEPVVIKYPEGRYEGEVNADGEPEGQGYEAFAVWLAVIYVWFIL